MKILDKYSLHIVLTIVFIISNIYLYWFGDYIFFYQENITLFIYSTKYLHHFIIKPGGLLEYFGNFLAQGYFSSAYGSIILSTILTIIVIVVNRIYKRVSRVKSTPLSIIVIPSLLLLLIQLNFNWFMWGNLGVLFTLIYFLVSISFETKSKRILLLLTFPVFYYVAGVFVWIYIAMYITYSLIYDKGTQRFIYIILLLLIAGLSFIPFKEVLFLQPIEIILLSPFSMENKFMNTWLLIILIGLIVLLPLLINVFSTKRKKYSGIKQLSYFIAVLIVTIALLFKLYSPTNAKMFKLEKFVYEQKWEEIIKFQENEQLPNLLAQYYYNLALSEKNMLCDRMFYSRQNFGSSSLIITWDAKMGSNNIARGIYFYYAVGLINEAHRWAYESMIAQGYRPENIKMLIKTNLINSRFKIAEKYIKILKKTLHYRKWTEKYEVMLNHPDLVEADPELGKKMKLLPKKDFTIEFNNPINNVIQLFKESPNNRIAYEYIMAWYMLRKNLDALFPEAEKMEDLKYKKIPRHIEEALVFYNMIKRKSPALTRLKISDETKKQFKDYMLFTSPFFMKKISGKKKLPQKIRNTYWYYNDFY